MKFDWDESKRRSNLHKHGIDFRDAERVFARVTRTAEDTRQDYGERRFVTLGLLDGRVVSIAHTETADEIRIISIRKATRRERAFYFQDIED